MPITQERMIDLVEAAKDYMAALEDIKSMVHQQARDIEAGRLDYETAHRTLQVLASPVGLLGQAQKSYTTIMLEARHFQKFKSKNEYERRRQAAKRAGVPYVGPESSKQSAPKSLAKVDKPDSIFNLVDETMDIDVAQVMGVVLLEDRRSDVDKAVDEMLKREEGK